MTFWVLLLPNSLAWHMSRCYHRKIHLKERCEIVKLCYYFHMKKHKYRYLTWHNHKMMCFVNYLMKTLQKITNADITQITKVGAHVKTSGWGNWYLTVFNNVISEYRGSVNKTELIKITAYVILNQINNHHNTNKIRFWCFIHITLVMLQSCKQY